MAVAEEPKWHSAMLEAASFANAPCCIQPKRLHTRMPHLPTGIPVSLDSSCSLGIIKSRAVSSCRDIGRSSPPASCSTRTPAAVAAAATASLTCAPWQDVPSMWSGKQQRQRNAHGAFRRPRGDGSAPALGSFSHTLSSTVPKARLAWPEVWIPGLAFSGTSRCSSTSAALGASAATRATRWSSQWVFAPPTTTELTEPSGSSMT
eukprot:363116-Chlamydomonas_euryale.AAC.12